MALSSSCRRATVPGSKEKQVTRQVQSLADEKMRTEVAKLLAEPRQIGVNAFLVPALAAAAVMGAIAALVKLFF